MPEVPEPIRRLVAHWVAEGKPVQAPTPWRRELWLRDFPANAAALRLLPEGLDRAALRAACVEAKSSNDRALAAFLAVMAWGFGDSVGYGRYRTGRIIESRPDTAARLRTVATILDSEGGALPGYRALASPEVGRLKGLGPSFGTKFLYFCQPHPTKTVALILDDFVAKWLARQVGFEVDPVPWSAANYARYLDQMHAWAATLGIEPDELELCIFRAEAARRGSQWADVAPPTLKPAPPPAPANLPFLSYPAGGRTLLGKPKWGDGTARRSYGLKVLEWCGYRCAYCGLDMSTFEGRLQTIDRSPHPAAVAGRWLPGRVDPRRDERRGGLHGLQRLLQPRPRARRRPGHPRRLL